MVPFLLQAHWTLPINLVFATAATFEGCRHAWPILDVFPNMKNCLHRNKWDMIPVKYKISQSLKLPSFRMLLCCFSDLTTKYPEWSDVLIYVKVDPFLKTNSKFLLKVGEKRKNQFHIPSALYQCAHPNHLSQDLLLFEPMILLFLVHRQGAFPCLFYIYPCYLFPQTQEQFTRAACFPPEVPPTISSLVLQLIPCQLVSSHLLNHRAVTCVCM